MRTVNVHEAKTGFSGLLAEIERNGTRIVICRNGTPVADLVPHLQEDRLSPDAKLGKLKIKYDPIEDLAVEDWQEEAR